MINYTYKIKGTSVSNNNTILVIHWDYTGTTEHGLSATISMTTFLNPPSDNFIQYEFITGDILISWIEGKENIEALKQNILQQIIELSNSLPV